MMNNNYKQLSFFAPNRLVFEEKPPATPAASAAPAAMCENTSVLKKHLDGLRDELKKAIKEKRKADRVNLEKEISECERKENLAKEYQALQKRFPKIKKNPYLVFATEDNRVYKFLEKCSLADLQNLCVIKPDDALIKYMEVESAWVKAGKKKSDPVFWESLRKEVMASSNTKITPASVKAAADSGIGKFKPLLKEMGIENDFSKHVTADMMLAISVQEVAPATVNGGLRITSKARLELFRMMCDAGWQPQKMPAMWDSAISFGLEQMTLYTHGLLQKGYGEDTKDFLEGDFKKHTTVPQQINDALLLGYANLEAFSNIAKEYPKFMKVFEKASDEHKKRFITTVVAAYHNYGNRKSLRRRIKKTLANKFLRLEDYRTTFVFNMKGLPIAYKHSRNSGVLYSFVRHMKNSHVPKEDAVADAEPAGVPQDAEQTASEQADEEEDKKIIIDTLLVRIKNGQKYYTFTAPHVKLYGFLKSILQPPYTLDDIKAFNGIKTYKIGDILDVPIKFFPPMFHDRWIVRVKLNGSDINEAMADYMVGGVCPENRSIVLLYGCTRPDELVFPAKLLKED